MRSGWSSRWWEGTVFFARIERMDRMPDAQVITVLGPIPSEKLGVTDAHDHLFLRTPALPGQEFDDAGKAIEEVKSAKPGGLQTIVEVTPIGLGRSPAAMRAVAE